MKPRLTALRHFSAWQRPLSRVQAFSSTAEPDLFSLVRPPTGTDAVNNGFFPPAALKYKYVPRLPIATSRLDGIFNRQIRQGSYVLLSKAEEYRLVSGFFQVCPCRRRISPPCHTINV